MTCTTSSGQYCSAILLYTRGAWSWQYLDCHAGVSRHPVLILPGNPSNVNQPAELQAQISRLFLRFPSITMTLAQPGKVHSWPTCVCVDTLTISCSLLTKM